MSMRRVPTLIIGAGPAGLAAARALADLGVPYVHLEAEDVAGGAWNEHHPRRFLPTKSLDAGWQIAAFRKPPHLVTSREQPSRHAVGRYVDKWSVPIAGMIEHNMCVTDVSARGDGTWLVAGIDRTTSQPKPFLLGASNVVVATGRRDRPYVPSWMPSYTALTRDAHAQEHPGPAAFHADTMGDMSSLAGQRVLLIGLGETAINVVELAAGHCGSLTVSVNVSPWLVPHTVGGVSWLRWVASTRHLPAMLRERLMRLACRQSGLASNATGLATPTVPCLKSAPTLASPLAAVLRSGRAEVVPRTVNLDGRVATHAGGDQRRYDTIIAATGHDATPYLVRNLMPRRVSAHLYADTLAADHEGLYIVGHVHAGVTSFAHLEAQAHIMAQHVADKERRPERATFLNMCAKQRTPTSAVADPYFPWLSATPTTHYAALSELLGWPQLAEPLAAKSHPIREADEASVAHTNATN